MLPSFSVSSTQGSGVCYGFSGKLRKNSAAQRCHGQKLQTCAFEQKRCSQERVGPMPTRGLKDRYCDVGCNTLIGDGSDKSSGLPKRISIVCSEGICKSVELMIF